MVLAPFDRVAIGGELLLFRWKEAETADIGPPPTAEAAVLEFKRAMQVEKMILEIACSVLQSSLIVMNTSRYTLILVCALEYNI